ncbi:hypothetical protein N7472_005028 [Penicillium cf. griseofulvum]|uniref:Zn(2)-C6 fungal-type domain-containing protein n=1 Tax=Penicillium cf. griseofulvum TaxID=2972120 RepID=A0A9W9MFB6_9EURO|nr:hypothetical protein N7472_005028 [Penicillium cf. griseofulvum]
MHKACWTCRRRTIQCDQTKIPCAKCEKAGVECFEKRPLRWVKGIAIRGKLRGHCFESNVEETDETPSTKLNWKQIQHYYTKSPHLPCKTLVYTVLIGHRDSILIIPKDNIRIAKLFILYDSESNPFRTLLTCAMNDLTLQKCILAVAARHYANTGRSFDDTEDSLSPRFVNANVDALHFKKKTINALSLSLSDPAPSQKDAIVSTILLLIFLDLLESGIDGWRYHLRGAEGLVKLCHSLLEPITSGSFNRDPGGIIHETRHFVARQLSLVSTLGGALSGAKLRSELCANFGESRHQTSIIRSFLGCPEFILGAISYLSNQRHAAQSLDIKDDVLVHEHIQDILTMLKLIADFDCFQWASDSMQSKNPSMLEIQRLSLLSQAYRDAALLYGDRVLHAFKTSTGGIATDNDKLVSQLLNVIESLVCDAALFKCLLWPTFIAGLACQTHVEKTMVLNDLKRLWSLTCCLNVINASKILKEFWERKPIAGNLVVEESELHVLEQGWLLI